MQINFNFDSIFGRRWVQMLAIFFVLLFAAACENSSDSGDPLGPSNVDAGSSLITVTPSTVTLAKGDTITFAADGGTDTFTWSLNDTTLGSIGSDSGVFVASTKTGTVTITATDARGSTATATVTIGNKSVSVFPSTSKVVKGGTQTFTAQGATDPVFWSISSSSIGSIDVDTGVFTAGVTEGSATITVLDSDGDTVTATVEVIANTITLTPAAATLSAVGTQVYVGSGGTGTYVFSIKNDDSTSLFTTPTITTTTTSVTVTIAALPTILVNKTDQTFTITAIDGNGDSGTAKLTLIAQ